MTAKFKAGDVIRYVGDVRGTQTVLYVGNERYFVRNNDVETDGTGLAEFSRSIMLVDSNSELVPEAWELGKRYVRTTGGPVITVIAVAEDGSALARSSIDALWSLAADRRKMFQEAAW
jgi:hypothetical protein